jgi:hypothetical protein
MKNLKKLCLLAIFVMFCAVILSCASSGSGNPKSMSGLGSGVLAVGEWFGYNDENDKGDSTVSLTEAQEVIDGQTVTTYTVKGNVTKKFQYGFAGWGLTPDEATLELLKTAKALSFTIVGDGKRYSIKFKTSDVKDYAYHEYSFNTEAGVAETFEVPMGFFIQPSWTGSPVRLKPENVLGVEWQTHESWRKDANNPFEIKTWGFKIY